MSASIVVAVRDIGFEKFVALAMFLRDAVQIGEISGVGEHIDIAHEAGL